MQSAVEQGRSDGFYKMLGRRKCSLLAHKREPEKRQRFRCAGPTRKGLLAPFRPQRRSRSTKNASRFAQTGCGSQRPLRALSGTRVLLTAAPTAPPCFRHRRWSSLLHIFSLLRFQGPSVAARQLPAGERVQQMLFAVAAPLVKMRLERPAGRDKREY